MNRRLTIGIVLDSLGCIVYLLLSRGPLRVQAVTVPVHLLFLLSISWISWSERMAPWRRLTLILLLTLLTSVGSVYLDSLVIGALTPLHPTYFFIGFLMFLAEGMLFLSATWFIDLLARSFRTKNRKIEGEP